MAPVDLHHLANAPGFGKASEALKAAGCWQEYPAAPEWIIEVSATTTVTTRVKVRADDVAEAKRLAREKANDGPADWEIDVTSTDIDSADVIHDPR